MARSREDLVRWALRRAEENFASAAANLEAARLFAAAENIFRTVETTLEALLYFYGVREIEYPGRRKKFTGRLALQFLVRDTLVAPGRISGEINDRYFGLATELHSAGYEIESGLEQAQLEEVLHFAEDLLDKARATASDLLGS
jgi:HEPN domain-containing protein